MTRHPPAPRYLTSGTWYLKYGAAQNCAVGDCPVGVGEALNVGKLVADVLVLDL